MSTNVEAMNELGPDGNSSQADDVLRSMRWALFLLVVLSLLLRDTALVTAPLALRAAMTTGTTSTHNSANARNSALNRGAGALEIRTVDAADTPITNAVIDVMLVLDGRVHAVERRIARGSEPARVDDLPPGRYLIVANAPSLSRAIAWVVLGGANSTESVRMQLGPEAVLLGSVRRQGRGAGTDNTEPLVGIGVRAMPDGGEDEPEFATRTNPDGTFELHGLRPGTWRVEVDDPRYEPIVRRAVAAPARGISLILRAFSQVNVSVIDADSRERSVGARVTISGSGIWPGRTVEADADGHVVLDRVPSGVYEVRAQFGSLVAEPVAPLILDPGEEHTMTMALSEGALLEGRVVDAQTQRAIVDARVVITEDAISSTPRAVLSEEDGGFRLQGVLRRSHVVSARATGYVPRTNVLATPGPGQLAIVAMDREVTVRGRVVDSRHNPIANAQIEITTLDLDGQSSILNASARAFRDSLFDRQERSTAQLRPGRELGVTVGSVPRIPTAPRPLDSRVGIGASFGSNPSAELGGFVSDLHGGFQLGEVAPGALRVTASHPAYVRGETALVLARSGATIEVEVMLHEGGILDGRLVDEGGFAVRQQLIELRAEGDDNVRRVFTANDGTFRVPSLLGEFNVVAVINGVVAAREVVIMQDERVEHVQLQIERSMRTVHGRVVDERGYPVPGAEVQLQCNGTSARTLAGSDGVFSVMVAARGALNVSVRHPRFAPRTMPITSSESEEVRVQLNSGATVSIQPLVASCARGAITLELRSTCGQEQREIRAVTTQDIEHLCAGPITLLFRADGCVSARIASNARVDSVTQIPRVELYAGGAAEGRVIDGSGTAVAGATIHDADDELSQSVRSDRIGHFLADAVREGDRRLVARHPVLGVSEPVPVRILRGTTLRGIELRFTRAE